MNHYECIYILDPNLEEAVQTETMNRYRDLVGEHSGVVLHVEKWQRRRLAYEVGGLREGIYVIMNYDGDLPLYQELDRRLRLDEGVIRQMIVRLNEREMAHRQAQIDSQEKARLEAEERAAAQAAEAAAEAAAEPEPEAAAEPEVAAEPEAPEAEQESAPAAAEPEPAEANSEPAAEAPAPEADAKPDPPAEPAPEAAPDADA